MKHKRLLNNNRFHTKQSKVSNNKYNNFNFFVPFFLLNTISNAAQLLVRVQSLGHDT